MRTKHQHQIITRYYDNLENIMLQRLSELITELYLADKPARKKQLWERVHRAMVKLKVKPAIIEHIMEKQSVEVLAKNLQDWHKAKK
jgi:chorismate mutase